MIRLTGRGSPAEDNKPSRPAMPVNGVCPPGLSQSKPINTARGTPGHRQSVVTMLVWTLSPIPHGAAGSAESPAFRAPLDFIRGKLRR